MFKTDNEDEERVSGGKQTLGLMAFIVLVVGAVTMIINFALGIANDKLRPGINSYPLSFKAS